MTYQEVLNNARSRSTLCKVCPECNGLACKGMVPGPGAKGDGKSFTNCISYLKNIPLSRNLNGLGWRDFLFYTSNR